MLRRHLTVGLVAVGCLGVLAATGGPPLALHDPHALPSLLRTDPESLLTGVALDAAWAVALWLTLGTVLYLAGELPGAVGRCARTVAHAITPRLLRRVLDVSLGVGLAAVPAAPALAAPPVAAVTAAASSPTTVTALPPVPAPLLAPLPLVPDLDRPGGPGEVARGGGAAVPAPAPAPAPVAAGSTVVVHPGDSLWSIARRSLPPSEGSEAAVASAWPRWWQTNRELIGANPDLIQPGQQLTRPAGGGR